MSNTDLKIKTLLEKGIQQLELNLDQEKIEKLLNYIEEFHKWNKAYNLSAIRYPEEMISRHLLDSLAIVPYIQKHLETLPSPVRLLDVGTGGGLPGIPLAIVFPELDVTLLDSAGKKTRFLFQTALKLGLKNVTVENNRAERFSPEHKFAIVTSRAFASLQDMVSVTHHLLAADGQYWAMKGLYPTEELAACTEEAELIHSYPLEVPNCEGERHLLILKDKG